MQIPRTEIDETALVARLRSGSEEAFAEWIRDQGPAVLTVARRLLGNEEDARDATQETFLSAFRGIQGFQGGARLSTWLHRIAVNSALMRRRTLSRRREEMAEDDFEDLLPRYTPGGHHVDAPGPWGESADAAAVREETREEVRRAIERLPENYRLALTLRDIEELETDEVAEHLGITVNAAKIRVHRARQALRTLLDRSGTARAS
jgi:RNA polymerase sigma-70 factor (ECF subfamily)